MKELHLNLSFHINSTRKNYNTLMKALLIFIFIILSLQAKEEGVALYSSCKFCHGLVAEKIYMDKIPSIQNLNEESLISILSLYKKGKLDNYGYGAIMKMQMKNIPDQLIPILVKHIKDLK